MAVGRDLRFYETVERLTGWLAFAAALMLLAISALITYDVATRYLLGHSQPWVFDVTEYSLAWLTFLAAPWVLMRDGHVRVELIIDSLSPRLRRAIGIAASVVGLTVCLVLTWRTGVAIVEYYQREIMMPRIWRIPRWWPYAAVPVGAAVLTLAYAARLLIYLRLDDPESFLRGRRS